MFKVLLPSISKLQLSYGHLKFAKWYSTFATYEKFNFRRIIKLFNAKMIKLQYNNKMTGQQWQATWYNVPLRHFTKAPAMQGGSTLRRIPLDVWNINLFLFFLGNWTTVKPWHFPTHLVTFNMLSMLPYS